MAITEGKLASLGYECIEIEWISHEKVLRIYIDQPAGVMVDDCAKVSRHLMESEEFNSYLPDDFSLEVSSPGVERPLRKLGHFEKHVGEKVKVKLAESQGNRKQGAGVIKAVSPDGDLTLQTEEGEWTFPLKTLQKAVLLYDWENS
jgi:ribosome maturation factor RimP